MKNVFEYEEKLSALQEELEQANDRAFRASEAHVVTMSKLAGAERRNAVLTEALDGVAFYFRQHGVDQQLREIVEEALCIDAALNKPEEAK